jgi:RimJ/RimL family protein N-acetyltransferase
MDRKIYVSDEVISLSEYIDALDDSDCYNCWQDKETQVGYNHKFTKTFDEYTNGFTHSRFTATIIKTHDKTPVGSIFLSPENTLPDLAIFIYKPYWGKGFGTRAFMLGVRYCFEVLKLTCIYAGCYPHNTASMKMIQKCGFEPHPKGNQIEKHILTGEEIIQLDFVKHNLFTSRH